MHLARTAVVLLAAAGLLAGCRANVRDPACVAIYDDCARACQTLDLTPTMPDQSVAPYDQQCYSDCHARARSCQSQVDDRKKPGELE